MVILDELGSLDGAADVAPERTLSDENLAYVLFTSGSTGRPKGVLTSHRSLVRAFHAWNLLYRLHHEIRCIGQTAAFSFAVFQADWIRALCSGGKIVLCRPRTVLAPERLLNLFDQEEVHFTEVVPGVLRLLMAYCEETKRKPLTLKIISVGSDRWYVREHRHAGQVFGPRTKVIHTFGLTETAIDTAYYLGWDPMQAGHELTPIGRPWTNVRMYILNPKLRPVAPGQIGELFVGGALVTRGYAGRPDLTAERFLPDPWAREPGGRMYRTGDLARLLPSDDVHFLGRKDHQIKIRGFRVEPGEVEAAVSAIEGVAQCVVTASITDNGEARLIAHVVGKPNTVFTPSLLWERTKERLVDYMVPSAFVILTAFPLTRSGKIDRTALPKPGQADLPRVSDTRAPRDFEEIAIASLWSELLDVDQIGIDDNFFALGGHSLLGVRLLSRIQSVLGVQLQLADLFAEPTVAKLAERARLLRSDKQSDWDSTGEIADSSRTIPLSREQLRLWIEYQAEPDSPAYHIVIGLRFPPPLDSQTLERALAALVTRHQSLRTIFEIDETVPVQRILEESPVFLQRIDGGAETWAEAVRAASQKPFDLCQGPVVRALVHCATGNLILVIHHIVVDGWSLGIIERELRALYQSDLSETPVALAKPGQYSQYVVWQSAHLSRERIKAGLQYWCDYLGGARAGTGLPTDFPRRINRGIRGASVGMKLPKALYKELEAFCEKYAVTPFVVLTAALGTVVSRLSGQDSVLLGYPSTNRGRPELQDIVGLFANTLVARVDTADNPSFLDLVKRVHLDLTEGLRFADTPYDEIVGATRAQRGVNEALFHVMLAFQDSAPGDDTSEEVWTSDLGTAKFDWTVTVFPFEGGIRFVLEYDASLFLPDTILRHAKRLCTLMTDALARPDMSVRLLSFLSEAEWRIWTKLAGLPAMDGAALDDKNVVAQIVEHVRRAPAAPALWFRGQTITYAELWARVSFLTIALDALKMPAEARVAVYLERDVDLVAAIIAVMQSGSAYVPIDPAYPAERVEQILNDSEASAVITRSSLRERLGLKEIEPSTLLVDDIPLEQALDTDGGKTRSISPRQLAYVMYTSGSTGKPKGVMVEHSNVSALVDWMRCSYKPGDLAGVVAATSVCFDLSIFELIGTLACGGRVVLVENAVAIRDLPESAEARLVNTVPSAASELAATNGIPSTVRVLNVAGEAVTTAAAKRFTAKSDRHNYNLYGPTETCVYSTCAAIRGDDSDIPIGRPLPGETLYLLDEWLQPVPLWIEGDLFIGGAGVSRGYLSDPALTAERFLPDPFSGKAGARMYKTGDRARWRPDGQLMFCGRRDQQVKIRGFRVELGEVESELSRCPGIKECAVAVAGERPEVKRLVAFVVLQENQVVEIAAFRYQLDRRLPAHMVPADFRVVDNLPRTPNGKIDRKALPVGEDERPAAVRWIGPQSDTEKWVVATWEEILGRQAISTTDNLFALGATSLLAITFLARAEQTLGVRLTLGDLLEATTIATLAARIESAEKVGSLERIGPLSSGADRSRPIPLSFGQQGIWFATLQQRGHGFVISMDFAIRGDLATDVVKQALQDVISRHEALRTVFVTVDGEPFQKIGGAHRPELPEIFIPWPGDPEGVRAHVLAKLANSVFDLASGPLSRFVLLRYPGGEARLCAGIHHLVFDAWSGPVFATDVGIACDARATGGQPAWRGLEAQPADYAVDQRRILRGELLQRRLAFWQGRLKDGAVRTFKLDREVRRRLLDITRGNGATLFSGLIASLWGVFVRSSGQNDIVLGCATANRPGQAYENVIGFFVDTLMLRFAVNDDTTFAQLVRQVQEGLIAGIDNSLPFELLLQELRPLRQPHLTPWFQIMVTMLEGASPASNTSSLPLPVQTRYELAISFQDSANDLALNCEYDLAVYSHEAIERFVALFRRCLSSWTKEPETALDALPLLDQSERETLRAFAGSPPTPLRAPIPVWRDIWQYARDHPDDLAVVGNSTSVTYHELCRRADRIAGKLTAEFRDPQRVAVCLERSAEAVIAMLGVFRAGATYVPIDSRYPVARIRTMIDEVAPCAVISRRALAALFPPSLRLVDVAHETTEANGLTDRPDAAPTDIAYIIFTSGTTGRPKGVMISHHGLAACVSAQRWFFEPRKRRVLQFAPLSFDASIFEYFLALMEGGTLCIPHEAASAPGGGLEDFIVENQITDIVLPPSIMAGMGDLSRGRVRRIMFAGERLPEALARRFAQNFELYNLYGPTEASIWSAGTRLRPNESITIGRPTQHSRIYVLDAAQNQVPVGVVGEIYIGGPGVAAGYLERPELTAERFQPDPWAPESGVMYRTGDLGRFNPDGQIEFAGRRDQQVKVHGVRIELGEVEAALNRISGVAACAVVACPDDAGETRLVAYVVPEKGITVSPSALRDALGEDLPRPMIPTAFVVIDSLPTTLSGKLDTSALPTPQFESTIEDSDGPPKGPLEELIGTVWGHLLSRDQLGAHEDFFLMGGNSLVAARAAAQISAIVGREVPVDLIFREPTISRFGRALSQLTHGPSDPIVQVQTDGSYPLSAAQRALWIARKRVAGSNIIVSSFPLKPDWTPEIVRRSVELIHRRHRVLSAQFGERAGRPYQEFAPDIAAPFSSVTVGTDERNRSETLAEAANQIANEPFDLRNAPLYRVVMLTAPGADPVLLIAMHHLVSDGWSLAVYFNELRKSCAAFASEAKPSLPPIPVQYGDFVVWEHRPGAVTQEDLQSWDELLRGCPSALPFPKPGELERLQNSEPAVAHLALEKESYQLLTQFARTHCHTLFMVLVGAMAVTLRQKYHTNDVVLCTDSAGRIRPELEPLIGLFLNQLVLRIQLQDNATVKDAMEAARAGCLAAYRLQHVPFEQIVRRHPHLRKPGAAPISQVKINLQPFPDGSAPSGTELQSSLGPTTADLHLTIFAAVSSEGLRASMVYNPALLSAGEIDAIRSEFRQVLRVAGAAPDTLLSHVHSVLESESLEPEKALR
jgi:amino acid adenylation domain-containing protein